MSAGTRPVPTNLDSWPGVTDLMIDQKYMLHVLWSSPSSLVSVVGVGQPGTIERLCSCSRLDEAVVLEALRELDRRGLVCLDEHTREVGVRRWCAFHKFGPKWAAAAASAYSQIASPKIKGVWAKEEGVKGIFPSKSTVPSPNSNSNSNSNAGLLHARDGEPAPEADNPASKRAASPPPPPVGEDGKFRRPYYLEGVECWYPTDESKVRQLVGVLGAEAVRASAKKIAEGGRKPLFSYVLTLLECGNANPKQNCIDYGKPGQVGVGGDAFGDAARRSRDRRAAGRA